MIFDVSLRIQCEMKSEYSIIFQLCTLFSINWWLKKKIIPLFNKYQLSMYDLCIATRNKCATNSSKKVSNDKIDVVALKIQDSMDLQNDF